jgi:hypothetical protein
MKMTARAATQRVAEDRRLTAHPGDRGARGAGTPRRGDLAHPPSAGRPPPWSPSGVAEPGVPAALAVDLVTAPLQLILFSIVGMH